MLAFGLEQSGLVLDAQAIVFHQGLERTTGGLGVDGPRHAQGIQEQLGINPEPPHQGHEVKAVAVVGDEDHIRPIDMIRPLGDIHLVEDDLGRFLAPLVGQGDDLGLRVGAVGDGRHLGQ